MNAVTVVLDPRSIVAHGIETIEGIAQLTGLWGLGGHWSCLLGGMIRLEGA